MLKKLLLIPVAIAMMLGLTGCPDDASVADHNITKAADNFEVVRRIAFINGITDRVLLEIVGKCSVEWYSDKFAVICKVPEAEDGFKKHFLGRADNVFPVVEQIAIVKASVNHYRMTIKPQVILPDYDLRGDFMEAVTPNPQ